MAECESPTQLLATKVRELQALNASLRMTIEAKDMLIKKKCKKSFKAGWFMPTQRLSLTGKLGDWSEEFERWYERERP